MCTALCFRSSRPYAGRHLDMDSSLGECLTLMPRGFVYPYRRKAAPPRPYAILGMAYTPHGVPLYYDAVNEKGLYMAGLHFPNYAVYDGAEDALAPFEMIPYVLTHCATVRQAAQLLSQTSLSAISYSDDLPLTPLHWFVADARESLAVEPLSDGLRLVKDPVDVLTNSPPLCHQLLRLAEHTACGVRQPSSSFAGVPVTLYSGGLGALGLPGDWSSSSRFVRAAFTSRCMASVQEADVSACFQALDTVRVPKGCVRTDKGTWMHTVYTGVCDLQDGRYYLRRGEAFAPRAVAFDVADLDGRAPMFF